MLPQEDDLVQEELVRRLGLAVPALHPVLREHLRDNDQLLSHLFFGDVTRWAVAQDRDSPEFLTLLAFLESTYAEGNFSAKNLILASFIENLPDESPIWQRLGPELAARR